MNLHDDELPIEQDRLGFRWRRARFEGERLQGSVYELPPGEKTWPYHWDAE